MKSDPRFSGQNNAFWANIRAVSESIGYTNRAAGTIKIPTEAEIKRAMEMRNLKTSHLFTGQGRPTDFCCMLRDYFEYRAKVLNELVEPRLMDADRAKKEFETLRKKLKPTCPLPMNKQKGEKKTHAFLTGIVNMIIEQHAEGISCDFDPRYLTTVTKNNIPLRTLARRVDGAFPSTVNPVAIWEIKEYYYTTTFGSRVADGVYETLLDGMELAELRHREKINVHHSLIIDSHYTWWVLGRSYLCRIIDTLNMGYIDEALFGYEVIERLPLVVKQWADEYKKRRT